MKKLLAVAGVSIALLGNAFAALADSSVGTDISTSAGGVITSNGLLTGQAGLTATGAAVNLNASSNFVTNIGTGTTTSAVSIGGGSNTLAVNSSSWDVSTLGVISGLTGLTSTGVVTLSGAELSGASPLVLEGATADTFETILAVTDPTADRTITLPNAAGTVAVSASGLLSLSALGDITCATCATSALANTFIFVGNGGGVATGVAMSGDVTIANTGVTTIGADTVALTTDTTGNYVATITSGNGVSGASTIEGGTPTLNLAPLTGNWDQTGAFDISLNNASSEIRMLESSGATFFGLLDVGDLAADRTYTFPDASGTVLLAGGVATFTDLTATGNVTMNDAGADAILIGAAADTVTIISDTLSLADNNWNVTAAGLANFVSIGAGTAGTGAFTTLTTSGLVSIGGHVSSTGTTIAASTTGTCATDSATGTDTRGVATGDCTAGQTVIVTFGAAYGTAPICVISPVDATAATATTGMAMVTSTTAVMTITANTATGGQASWNYHCIE